MPKINHGCRVHGTRPAAPRTAADAREQKNLNANRCPAPSSGSRLSRNNYYRRNNSITSVLCVKILFSSSRMYNTVRSKIQQIGQPLDLNVPNYGGQLIHPPEGRQSIGNPLLSTADDSKTCGRIWLRYRCFSMKNNEMIPIRFTIKLNDYRGYDRHVPARLRKTCVTKLLSIRRPIHNVGGRIREHAE